MLPARSEEERDDRAPDGDNDGEHEEYEDAFPGIFCGQKEDGEEK